MSASELVTPVFMQIIVETTNSSDPGDTTSPYNSLNRLHNNSTQIVPFDTHCMDTQWVDKQ